MIPFEWEAPQSLDRAIALLASGDELVRPISGGTALMLMMKAGVFTPSRLVSLSNIEPEHSRTRTRPADNNTRRLTRRYHSWARRIPPDRQVPPGAMLASLSLSA